jgi:hypothetical protein
VLAARLRSARAVQSIAANIADAPGGPERVELWPQPPHRPRVVREAQVCRDVCTRRLILRCCTAGRVRQHPSGNSVVLTRRAIRAEPARKLKTPSQKTRLTCAGRSTTPKGALSLTIALPKAPRLRFVVHARIAFVGEAAQPSDLTL